MTPALSAEQRAALREKQRKLEALGWKFERYSSNRRRWVPISKGGKQYARIIEHAWLSNKEHDS